MIHKTQGLVLHHIKYRESGIIVYMYTRDWGRQAFIVQGIRRKNSPGKINLFQPLFQLDLDFYYKDSQDLHRLKEFKAHTAYSSIPYDINKRGIALFLAELLYRCLKTQESVPELFLFIKEACIFLDQTKESVVNFHLLFLLKLSHHLGFHPNRSEAHPNAYFDLRDGIFLMEQPNHPFYIPREYSNIFQKLLNCEFQNMKHLNLSYTDRSQLMSYIIDFYQLHDQELAGLKSLKILKELFSP